MFDKLENVCKMYHACQGCLPFGLLTKTAVIFLEYWQFLLNLDFFSYLKLISFWVHNMFSGQDRSSEPSQAASGRFFCNDLCDFRFNFKRDILLLKDVKE